jgi:predicted O-methyltransferase YrrM
MSISSRFLYGSQSYYSNYGQRLLPSQLVGAVSADQGVFVALLVQLLGAKKTLEVGLLTGYNSLTVLQELLSVEL